VAQTPGLTIFNLIMTHRFMPAADPRELARGYRALQRITVAIRSQVDLGRVLDTLVADTGQQLDLSVCALARWEPAGAALVFCQEFRRDTEDGSTPSLLGLRVVPDSDPNNGVIDRRLFREQRSLVRPGADQTGLPAVLDDLGDQACVVTPMVADQRVVGLLVSARVSEMGPWRDDEVECLHAAADITAVAIQHAAIRARLRILAAAVAEINSPRDMPALMRHLTEAAMLVTHARMATAGVREGDEMVCREICREGAWEPIDVRFSRQRGLPGWSWTNRAPCLCNDAPGDPRGDAELIRRFGVLSALTVPIVGRDGEVIGFFELHNKAAGAPFGEEDLQFTATLAHHAALALELRKA